MSLTTLYEDLLFLGGYVTDPHMFEKQLPNGDRVRFVLEGEVSETPAREPERARAA